MELVGSRSLRAGQLGQDGDRAAPALLWSPIEQREFVLVKVKSPFMDAAAWMNEVDAKIPAPCVCVCVCPV